MLNLSGLTVAIIYILIAPLGQEFREGLAGQSLLSWESVSAAVAVICWLELKSSKGLTRTGGLTSKA